MISADQENDADVIALTGASLALNMSRIPFRTPVAAVRIGRIQGQWVLNPTFQQLEYSDLDIIVAGSESAITMVEGGALEVPEEEIAEGLLVAHEGIRQLIGIQREVLEQIDTASEMEWAPQNVEPSLAERITSAVADRIRDALQVGDKTERNNALASIRSEAAQSVGPDEVDIDKHVSTVSKEIEKREMREQILSTGRRSDGRGLDEVRPITIEVGVLPRAHGSALFTRGQTQSLGTVTLGTQGDEQAYDTVDFATQQSKSFMLHYNFPPVLDR